MAAVAIAASFSGCNKMEEGEFNPKQKLVEVYQETSDNESGTWQSYGNVLTEAYQWNGNVLESISYYDGREVASVVETFQYDEKNRIIGSTMTENGFVVNTLTTKYVYDDDELEEINIFENGTLISSYEFEHEDGKIVELQVRYVSNKKVACTKALQYADPLRRIMPQQVAKEVNRIMAKAATKGEDGYAINFEWDGNNVSVLSTSFSDGSIKVTYKYDNKLNPYFGLFTMYSIESNMAGSGISLFSKNNPVEMSATTTMDTTIDSYSVNFNYQYEGKYPISSTLESPVVSYDYQYNEATGEYEVVETEYQQRVVTTYVYAK